LKRAASHAALLLMIGAGGSACDVAGHEEAQPITATQFAQVYTDLLQATSGDSLSAARADSVFKAHRLTRQEFEAAARYYSAEAERWGEVLKLVVAEMDSQMAKEARRVSTQSNEAVGRR